ncbi:MAG: orotate phosphoribosyltransferase [Kiritimatiellae bacterium]|nr:orotate phosphoribosyltransferase [Kiritimatiellia bacterium]
MKKDSLFISTSTSMSSSELLTTLKDVGALREGHFLLASGRHSAHYVQVAQLSQYPARLQPLLETAKPQLEKLGAINTVFYPAIGALPVGQQMGLALRARAIFAERNAQNQMELRRGFELRPGDKVLLVEDVITTGGTLKEIVGMVESAGAEVLGVFCIINRSGNDTWRGYPLVSLLDLSFPTYAPDEVPAELAEIPVYRPGTKAI